MNPDIIAVLNNHQREERIQVKTRYLAPEHHITLAIQYDRDEECIEAYRAIMCDNDWATEDGIEDIPLPFNPRCFYAACDYGYDNCPTIATVRFWNFGFQTSYVYIHMGNCSTCYQALPLGVICEHCQDSAKVIYCVSNFDEYSAAHLPERARF